MFHGNVSDIEKMINSIKSIFFLLVAIQQQIRSARRLGVNVETGVTHVACGRFGKKSGFMRLYLE
jgi:hypothetical protein